MLRAFRSPSGNMSKSKETIPLEAIQQNESSGAVVVPHPFENLNPASEDLGHKSSERQVVADEVPQSEAHGCISLLLGI